MCSVTAGWRYMAAIGAIPAIILCCLLLFCPESPGQFVSPLGGFNSILYYSGTLFAAVGFNQPVAVGASIAANELCLHLDQFVSCRSHWPSEDSDEYAVGDGRCTGSRCRLLLLDSTKQGAGGNDFQEWMAGGCGSRVYVDLCGILLSRHR